MKGKSESEQSAPILVQVTKGQKKLSDLEVWERFLTSKGISTEVRTETSGAGIREYFLWRSLTDDESNEIAAGKTEIVKNYLTFKNIESMCIHRRTPEEMKAAR